MGMGRRMMTSSPRSEDAMKTIRATPPEMEPVLVERPLPACTLLPDGQPGIVTIRGVDYEISFHSHLPATCGAVIVGYRLVHCDGERVYDLHVEGRHLVCDCASCVYRKCACKHVLDILYLCRRGFLPFPDDYPGD